ncbi:MAG: DUF933 domain-containing protein [Candidatus Paceibacterota bacterium]
MIIKVLQKRGFVFISQKGSAVEKGLLRTEGKEYIVQDGDVVEFKI